MIELICNQCKRPFLIHKYRLKTCKFCSMSCYAISRQGVSFTNAGSFKKGHSYNKNRKISLEARKKHSLINKAKGIVPPSRKGAIPWNKDKALLWLRGENSPLWKGTTKERILKMGQIEYRLWRKAVFQRDDYTCQMCLARGVKIHADHIKPWATHPELRYAIDNGRTVCVSCHYLITYGREMIVGQKWCGYTKN